jgi:hypothetical protein
MSHVPFPLSRSQSKSKDWHINKYLKNRNESCNQSKRCPVEDETCNFVGSEKTSKRWYFCGLFREKEQDGKGKKDIRKHCCN